MEEEMPYHQDHEQSAMYPRFSSQNGGVLLPFLATLAIAALIGVGFYYFTSPSDRTLTADISAPPAVTTPKDPGLPTPALQNEETRPTQAPIR
jgi:hypothetical protein